MASVSDVLGGSETVPLLAMQGIGKRFGGVVALDSVSLAVGRGEVVALIGENGAGKSTLMKVLGGLYTPDAGEIRVDGTPVRLRSPRVASDLKIAFIHQELNVLDNLDVAANVYLGREPTRGGPLRLIDRARMERDTAVYLAQVGLVVAPDTLVASLSLARRQMVEIAKALSQEARLIILDEPTSSLTPAETDRLLDVMRGLRERGVSMIYVSHRLGEIEQIADRVVALRDGRNAGELQRAEIRQAAMVRLMVGRDLERVSRRTPAAQTAEEAALPPRLEVRKLRTPRYPDTPVSFAVRAGEVLGFAGLVGAGRTEVAQSVFGVFPALSGEILMEGAAIRVNTSRHAIDRGIYLIPEDRRHQGLILDLAIGENISLPDLSHFAVLGGAWVKRGAERSATTQAAGRLHIKSAATRGENAGNTAALLEAPASSLSGGNQQKVVLSRWLALDPRVLIFDEPTRGIDVGAKAEIYDLIRSLAARGVAIMLISSDMEEVLALSDRIAVMHEGRINGILSPELFSEEAVMRLAVGENNPQNHPLINESAYETASQ